MEFKTNWSDVLLAMARSRHTKEARPLGVLRPQHDCRARGGTASRLSAKHNTDLSLCSQQHDRRWRCAALAALFCSFFVRKTRARRTTPAFQQKATRRKGKGTFAIIQSRSALCSLLSALCSLLFYELPPLPVPHPSLPRHCCFRCALSLRALPQFLGGPESEPINAAPAALARAPGCVYARGGRASRTSDTRTS